MKKTLYIGLGLVFVLFTFTDLAHAGLADELLGPKEVLTEDAPEEIESDPLVSEDASEPVKSGDKSYTTLFEGFGKRDKASEALVKEIIESIQNDRGKTFSSDSLPTNGNVIDVLRDDYLSGIISDPEFQKRWELFLEMTERDRLDQEIPAEIFDLSAIAPDGE